MGSGEKVIKNKSVNEKKQNTENGQVIRKNKISGNSNKSNTNNKENINVQKNQQTLKNVSANQSTNKTVKTNQRNNANQKKNNTGNINYKNSNVNVNKNSNVTKNQNTNKGNTIIKNQNINKNQNNNGTKNTSVNRSGKANKIDNADLKKTSKTEEIRDTSGDTKIFQRITREDIEKEKRLQATLRENEIKNKKNQEEQKKSNDIKYNDYQKNNKNKKLNNYEENNKINQTKEEKKTPLLVLLILLIIILIILIASTVFGIINKNGNKIIRGVFVNNIEISNLTKEEALAKVNAELNSEENNYITVTHGDYSKEIHLSDIEGKFNTEEIIDEAYNLGRTDNIMVNNYKTVETMIKNTNMTTKFTYNEELLERNVNEIALELPDVATEASYILNENKIIIQNSKDGVQIKSTDFKQKIIDSFANGENSFEIPVEEVERKEIDVEKIHEEVYVEPKDAYYTINPPKVYKEENGLDFAISIEQAKEMLSEEQEIYEIELEIVKPNITVNDLDDGAFPDQLSTFTTNYGTGDANRNTNIAVAARSINSMVVMPGETFSFNDLIGECSTRTGYKESTIYLNGELSRGIGGGICQVSTTLYNAVLRANLEIVERRNHSLGVTYVPAGHDAMVSIGSSDFKFKNNRDYPVKVIAFVGKGSITCQIYGLKQDVEYEVKLASTTIESTDTRYKVQTYKILYLNRVEISRTLLSTDTYKRH